MIDWYNLLMNALWILGCTIVLTTISYTGWLASVREEKFLKCINISPIQISLNIGGVLFSTGLAGTTEAIWMKILWVIIGFGFLIQIMTELYRLK